MGHAPTCPRCGGSVRAPGLWSSAWQCSEHGSVTPFHVLHDVGPESLEHVTRLAKVPVWRPVGLGSAWGCSGVGYAGDDRDGARAVVLASSGPSPLSGPADVLLVAEEPGVGLGAHLAGMPGVDPGEQIASGLPDGQVIIGRHPTALWPLPEAAESGDAEAEGRAAFVGEALGFWLWLLIWPATAGVMVYDGIELVDHRDFAGETADLSFAALCPRLS